MGGGFETQALPAVTAWAWSLGAAGFGYCKLNLANSHNSVLISLTIALCSFALLFAVVVAVVAVAVAWHGRRKKSRKEKRDGWGEKEKIFAYVRKSFLVDSIFSLSF